MQGTGAEFSEIFQLAISLDDEFYEFLLKVLKAQNTGGQPAMMKALHVRSGKNEEVLLVLIRRLKQWLEQDQIFGLQQVQFCTFVFFNCFSYVV
jgi:hypothetical protein